MNGNDNESQSRRAFFAVAAAGGAALASFSRTSSALAAGTSNIITVGTGGTFADLGSAVASISGSSSSNGYLIRLLPGVHAVPHGGLTLPPYVAIEGSGQSITEIACMDGDIIRVASGCELSRLTLSGDFDAARSAYGILMNGAATAVDFKLENVDMYVTGGYGAAIRMTVGDNTCFLHNVNIYTTSVGLHVGGFFYVSGSRIFLSGNATGTPYYGVYVPIQLRLYIWASKIGTGYGKTLRPGFDTYLEVKNDPLSNVIAIYVPASNPTDPRIECDGLNSYARNDVATSASVIVACVRAEAGHVRLYGGLLQAETPANGLIRESLSQAGQGIIVSYGVLFSGSDGNIWGTNATATSKTTGADHNTVLRDESGGVMFCDASTKPYTLRLPSYFSSFRNGIRFVFVKTDTTANAVTINGSGLTINGQPEIKLVSPYQKVEIIASKDAWFIL